jgi:hypothetical protein
MPSNADCLIFFLELDTPEKMLGIWRGGAELDRPIREFSIVRVKHSYRTCETRNNQTCLAVYTPYKSDL